MKLNSRTILSFFFLTMAWYCQAQQISRDELLFLTHERKGERFGDGIPKVSDAILNRMKLVTLECLHYNSNQLFNIRHWAFLEV